VTPSRHFRNWTLSEDQVLLAFRPSRAKTLRQLADELGRTFSATRHRRKALLARRLQPGQVYLCRGCEDPLPCEQKHGYCATCRDIRRRIRYEDRYQAERQATRPFASRRGAPWSPDEDHAVLSAYPTVTIALQLGRTLASCRSRREKLMRQARGGGSDHAGENTTCGAA
jgi:hypothetical protein